MMRPAMDEAPHMTPPDRIAAVLAPHLGEHSADAVARHLCAKYDVHPGLDAARLAELREFLRRGLVVFVGAEAADRLAEECVGVVSRG
jgi:hypothetical protein